MSANTESKKLILLWAKSASGKDWYVKKMGWDQVVSHTTRDPRPGEVNGKDKWFDKLSVYLLAKEDDSVIAETNIQGNQYWTTESDFNEKDVFIVDVAGIIYLMNRYGEEFKNKFEVLNLQTARYKRLYRIIKRDGWKKGRARLMSDRQTFNSDLIKEMKSKLKALGMTQKIARN